MHSKQSLTDEFFAVVENVEKRKILKLKKRIIKYLSSKGQDVQLADFVRMLDMFVEEMETDSSELSHHIMSPVAERLINLCDWDFVDIRIASVAVGFTRDHNVTDTFAQKALDALETYKDDGLYTRIKFSICSNTATRLLRTKYYDLGYTTVSEEMGELAALFEKYADMVLTQFDNPEFLISKEITSMQKLIFYRDNNAIDAMLIDLEKKGGTTLYHIITKEVNEYNAFVGEDISKLQHTIRVGDNIRKLRLSRSMKVDDFARKFSLSGPFLHSIERGKRGATTYNILKISEKMGVTTDSLIKGKFRHGDDPKTKRQKLKALVDMMEEADVDWLYDSANHVIEVRSGE